MVNYAVSWRWDFISFDLPNEVKDKIYATPMQIYGERKDSLLWKSSHDGEFNMTSAYASNFTAENNPQVFMGNWVWKLDIWLKISSFLWLCHHNSVPIRQVFWLLNHHIRVLLQNCKVQ